MSNPFDWRNAPRDPKLSEELKVMDRRTRASRTVTAQVEAKRKTNPAYGTMFGIGQLRDSLPVTPKKRTTR